MRNSTQSTSADACACSAGPDAATGTSRRAFVRGVAAAGGASATAAVLAACSTGGGAAGGTGGGSTSAGIAPFELSAEKVPVGGGIVLADKNVVVTQPQAGVYAAFSAICTHQGCPLSSVEDRGAFCACHSSYFSIADGSPVAGPADTPLPPVPVAEEGGTLIVGGP